MKQKILNITNYFIERRFEHLIIITLLIFIIYQHNGLLRYGNMIAEWKEDIRNNK